VRIVVVVEVMAGMVVFLAVMVEVMEFQLNYFKS